MRRSELDVLASLVRDNPVRRILEIGMAHASSTLAMLGALKEKGSGCEVLSIDPYQFAEPPKDVMAPIRVNGKEVGSQGDRDTPPVRGQGVANVREAGFAGMHECIAEPDWVALPALLRKGAAFDLVLIDGYHSFESTLLDFFYGDRLLKVGGIVVFHDTAFPAVYKAVRYVMTNTTYALIGPRPEPLHHSLLPKMLRRVRYLLTGQSRSFRERRMRWCSLAAFRKIEESHTKELALADF
jgi:predicted O-methyltransferase YrrM